MGYWNNSGASPTKVTWSNPQVVPESQRQSGGWYYNPQSGMVERWWDDNDGPSVNQAVDPVESYLEQQRNAIKQTMAPLVSAFEDQQKRVSDYLENNPFAFDEQWLKDTKRQVTEEVNLEPYYKEKLSNYLEDVETTKGRAQEDETTLLKELDRQESVYLQQDKMTFQRQRELALEGLSDKGMLDTGSGQRELNRGDISHDIGVNDYLSRQDLRAQQAQQTTSRLLSDLGRDTNRFTTDLEREKQLQIQSDVQQRKQEKQNYWEAGLKKAQGAVAPGYNLYLG